MKSSVEFTGKGRPSSDGSSERLDSDNVAGTSGKPTHRSKRKRGQRRNKKWHEDSPDLKVPLTIAEEASKDVDEPPEKRRREEETTGDGIILPSSLSVSFLSWRFFDPLLSFF